MAPNSFTRRTFFEAAGGTAAAVAGLGLVGCGGSDGSDGNGGGTGGSSDTGTEPPEGSPCTTALEELPLPAKGQVYNNPQDYDNVKDGGDFVLPAGEIGPAWNYFSVDGNTFTMNNFWGLYMPVNMVLSDATASKFSANPDYIDSYESTEDSGKQVITVKINEKATFNDGTAIDWTGYETVWKLMNGQDPDYQPAATDGYDQIESVAQGDDAKTCVITMSHPIYPYEPIISAVAHPKMLDKTLYQTGWDNNPNSDLGAGPFKVESCSTSSVKFVRNDAWWGKPAKLDSITYKQMDSQALFNAFKNGEVDTTGEAASGSAEMLSNFSGMQDAYIRRADSLAVANIEINTTKAPLDDIDLRKAFVQCIDQDTIRKVIFQGVHWEEEYVGSLLVPVWADGYENNMPEDVWKDLSTAEDHAKAAKKTLEDAGWTLNGDYYEKDGKPAKFSFTSFGDSTMVKNRSQAIQKMAKDAGIQVDIDAQPSSEFSNVLTSGSWDTTLFGWSSSTSWIWNGPQIYGSDSASNFTHAGSAELDAKLAKVITISDRTEQLKEVNAAEKEALQSYAFIPVFAGPDCVVCDKGTANIGPALFLSVPAETMGWQKDAE